MFVFTTDHDNTPLIFNLHTSVGRGGQNSNHEDILLVQFLLRKLVERMPATTAEGKAADEVMRKVPLTGTCDQATIAGIEAFQKSIKARVPGTIVDGRMSPAKGINYGTGVWSIAQLNHFIRTSCRDVWPRLQDFGDCPGQLKVRFAEVL